VLATYADANGDQDRVVYMTSGGQLDFGVQTGTTDTIQSSASYNDGQWHFVVATQGSDGMRLYVDGQLVASDSTATAGSYVGNWQLGGYLSSSWPNQPAAAFSGSMSDAALFMSELTASQVQAEYSAGGGVTPTPPSPPPTPSPPSPPSLGVLHALSVTLAGSGAGTVSGDGLACPGACSGEFVSGTEVTLTATPAAGSTFAGWSGACSGSRSCEVTLGQDQAVTASFAASTAQAPTITSPPSNQFSTLSRTMGTDGKVTLKLATTDAGSFNARVTFSETLEVKSGNHKDVVRTVAYADASRDTNGSGTTSLTLTPNREALALLKVRHKLQLTIVVTFIPTGGSAHRTSEHATITAPTRDRLGDARPRRG
jgi:hypothetical protein